MKVFIDTDISGHWCLVEATHRNDWEKWKSHPDYALPRYAQLLQGAIATKIVATEFDYQPGKPDQTDSPEDVDIEAESPDRW